MRGPGGRAPQAPLPTQATRSEIELLLCCARTRADRRVAQRIRRLAAGPLDWVYFIRLAQSHEVLTLVHATLKTVCFDAVPETIGRALERYASRQAQRSAHLTGELLRLLTLLDAQAIPALPVKGPVLSAAVYGDLALREFHDLDILIHRRDALRAKGVLLSSGYALATALKSDGFPSVYGKPEYCFRRERDGLAVELCWRINPHYFLKRLDLETLGARRSPIRLMGATVDALPAEELLLVLCVHGNKHNWWLLRWICDVAELIGTSPAMNWRRVLSMARTLGCRRSVTLGLSLARDLLGAPLPDTVLHEIEHDAQLPRLATWVCQRLFREVHVSLADDRERCLFNLSLEWGQRLYYLKLTERLRDRIWNILLLLSAPCSLILKPSPTDRSMIALPKPLTFLYALARPFRIGVKYGGIVWAKRM